MSICVVRWAFLGYLSLCKNIKRICEGMLFLINPLKLTLLLKRFQVLMKLLVPNCEKYHVFCLLSNSKMSFCCKSIVFLSYSITLSWDTNNRCNNGSVYKPPPPHSPLCINPPKMLETLHKPWAYIRSYMVI